MPRRRGSRAGPGPSNGVAAPSSSAVADNGTAESDDVIVGSDLSWAEALRPRDFVAASQPHVEALAALAKRLFESARLHEARAVGPHDELLVDNFDEEQVWQQLQLRNKPLLRFVEAQVRKQHKEEAAASGDASSNDSEAAEPTGGEDGEGSDLENDAQANGVDESGEDDEDDEGEEEHGEEEDGEEEEEAEQPVAAPAASED